MQKLIILLAALSLVLPSAVSAKLYKCKNEQGEVVYTDQKCLNGEGEEMKLAPFSTYTPNVVPVPPQANQLKEDPAASYKIFEVIKPKEEKLIRSKTGRVNVTFKLEGPLLSLKGHKFAVALDGKKLKSRGVTNQIRLDSVNPGTHTLQVFVVDADDKVVKSSNTVKFYMQGKSQLNRPTPGIPDLLRGIPGSSNTIPGGAGTIPGGAPNIPGGRSTIAVPNN